MEVSLIISTYNRPDALDLVLRSVAQQTIMPTEVLIADDGSLSSTKELIENWIDRFPTVLRHIWHEDRGFRLSAIRNKAISEAKGEYIVQIDGDVVLHPFFIQEHIIYAEKGCFVSGSRVLLDEEKTRKNIETREARIHWYEKGVKHRLNAIHFPFFNRKLKRKGLPVESVYPHCRGCNMGYWKDDAIAINGYDESYIGWGLEDSDFVVRLLFKGCKSKKIKFAIIQYHLYHKENTDNNLQKNNDMFKKRIENKEYWVNDGIVKKS